MWCCFWTWSTVAVFDRWAAGQRCGLRWRAGTLRLSATWGRLPLQLHTEQRLAPDVVSLSVNRWIQTDFFIFVHFHTIPGHFWTNLFRTAHNEMLAPHSRLKFAERAFSIAAPKAWNSLPVDLRATVNTGTFVKKLKTFYFANFIYPHWISTGFLLYCNQAGRPLLYPNRLPLALSLSLICCTWSWKSSFRLAQNQHLWLPHTFDFTPAQICLELLHSSCRTAHQTVLLVPIVFYFFISLRNCRLCWVIAPNVWQQFRTCTFCNF